MKLNNHMIVTALILAASTAGAWAQTETASNAAPPNGHSASAPAQPPVTAADIQELKDALAAQQRQIQALLAQLHSKDKKPAQQPVQSAGPSVSAADANAQESPAVVTTNPQTTSQDKRAQNAGSSDEHIRNLERQIKALAPTSFTADVRLRMEPPCGGPSDQSLDRARARIRARFNAIATLADQFAACLTRA